MMTLAPDLDRRGQGLRRLAQALHDAGANAGAS
jgi:hypothetical protein